MVVRVDTAHLLDGGDDQAVVLVVTFQLGDEIPCIIRVLDAVVLTGKSAVLVKGLHAELHTVKKEYDLVRISRI